MSVDDLSNAAKFVPNLWQNLVQIIIQSRLGEKIHTIPKSPLKGSKMFNLEINFDEDISNSVKKYFGTEILTAETSFNIEILLRTKEKDQMVLEVWTLKMEENTVDNPSKNSMRCLSIMSHLLTSAICYARITPAFVLSFRQGVETYVILYKIYSGSPNFSDLGENFADVKVGQTVLNSFNLTLSVAYRTVLIMDQPRTSLSDPIMLKSDHFKSDGSPAQHRKACDRGTDSSDAVVTSDESIRFPFNAKMDLNSNSPKSHRSRNSSDGSLQNQTRFVSHERIFAPFASKSSSLENFVCDTDEISLSSLLSSTNIISKLSDDANEVKQKNHAEKPKLYSDVLRENSEDSSPSLNEVSTTKNLAVSLPKEENNYVVVDIKAPFSKDLELSSFIKEWQAAPSLHLFEKSIPNITPQSMDSKFSTEKLNTTAVESTSENCKIGESGSRSIIDELKDYKSKVKEFDDLVESFNIEDQELE